MPDLSRFPWRTRAGLLAVIDAVAGLLVALGVQGDIDGWVSVATAVVAVLVNVGVVKAGEKLTTPTTDPRADDGTPLVPESEAGRVTFDITSDPDLTHLMRRWLGRESS